MPKNGLTTEDTRPQSDSVTVSAEARRLLREEQEKKSLKEKQEARLTQGEGIREQIRQAQEQADAQGEAMENHGKCMLIASRIMSGDKVPKEDEQFLIENNAELYMRAITMRVEKEDPREYDRLSEDKERGEAAPAPEAGPPETAPPDAGGSAPAEPAPVE